MKPTILRSVGGDSESEAKPQFFGTEALARFNDLAELAAQLCAVPRAALILVNGGSSQVIAISGKALSTDARNFVLNALGQEQGQIRDVHANDGALGEAFSSAGSDFRFLASVPLLAPAGQFLGVLCVTDNQARDLSASQMTALEKLGRQAVALLSLPADESASYLRLFESALDGILIIDFESGQITEANPAAVQLLSFSREQLLAKKIWEIGCLQGEEKSKARFEALKARGSLETETLTLRGGGGEERDVKFVAQVFSSGGRSFAQCTLRDLTDVTHAETIDQEFKDFIASTLNGLAAQIVTIDAADEAFLAVKDAEAGIEVPSENEDHSQLAISGRANGIWTKEANMVVQGIREVMAQRRATAEQDESGNLIEQRWFNAFVTYFMDSELMRIVVARQEVFERITAEKKIRFQAKLLDVVGEAVIATDAEGVVVYWNRCAETLYGWTAEEALGQHIAPLVIPKLEWRRARQAMDSVRGGEPWYGEFVLRDKSGVHFSAAVTNTPIYDDGAFVGTIGISKDITERKRAEALLRESEERFRLMVESVQDYAIFRLDNTGHITSWNLGAQRLKGYRAEEVIGRHFSLFYLPEDIEAGLPQMEIEVATATDRFEGEGLRLRKDGEKFWAHVIITAIRDEHGVLRGFSKVTRDITERKHAEEELERTNREILTIWESMTDAFVAVNADWTLTHVNEHAAFIWKKDRAEVLGKNLWDLFPSVVWLSFHREYHRAVRDQVPVVFEEFYPPLNTWFEIHAYPSSLGLSIYFRDVSQRKAAEQAIRNSEARFQSIVANAPGMVYQFILHPNGNIAIPFVNDGSRRLFGLAPDQIQNNQDFFAEIIHPADYAEWLLSIQESARDLSPWDWEGRIKLENGKMKWVQGAARPKRMPHGGTLWDGLLIEITDRKQAEEERDRFFTLSLDMLCISDFDGRFKRLNPAFQTTLGYTVSELEGKSFLEYVHPDDLVYTASQLDSLAAGAQTIHFVNRYRCKDNSYKWLSWQTVPYEDLAYAVAHDITPLKEAEADLRQANDELELRVARRTEQLALSNEELRIENIERQMTLASLRQVTEAFRQAKEEADAANLAKSEFLSRMSHELRTPLNAILGFGQILEMRSLETEDLASVNHILKAGWHLLDLVNEILDIARVEAGHLELALEAIAIADVVPECCSLLRPLADQREIRLDENGSALSEYFILADRQRIRQILINLLSNAIKYNITGGYVYVSSELTVNKRIRISIRDTGSGISDADTKKLFTPFERLSAGNSRIEGSGLGLALSQRLLTAMGGRLGVQSEVGKGSTFWIELPQAEPNALAHKQFLDEAFDLETLSGHSGSKLRSEASDWTVKPAFFEGDMGRRSAVPALSFEGDDANMVASPALVSSASLRILVVEDNQVNQQVILRQLKNLGHEVILLDNGIAAIETWQKISVDLILMDCNMPQMNGYVAAREIRSLEAEDRHIPIIALTANAMSGDREKCLEAGMDDYLSKPTKQSRLAEVIERWISNLGIPNEIITPEKPKEKPVETSVVLSEERWSELETELDPELVEELVRLFLDETPRLIQALGEVLPTGNANAIFQNAHKIKGSCGTMGASGMEDACREIEKCAQSGHIADCIPLYERLQGEMIAVKSALQFRLAAPLGQQGN